MNNPLVCCLCNKGMLGDEAAVSCRNEQCSNHGHATCAGYTKRGVTSFSCPACKVHLKPPNTSISESEVHANALPQAEGSLVVSAPIGVLVMLILQVNLFPGSLLLRAPNVCAQ